MEPSLTSWTLIRDAGSGSGPAREKFVHRYTPVIRAYLGTRWRGGQLIEVLDDAAQDVFIQCFKEGGVLERVDQGRDGGFRAFFYGVVRNVARGREKSLARRRERYVTTGVLRDQPEADRLSPTEAFDRAWVRALILEAIQVQRTEAEFKGDVAKKRVELLRLRFEDELPVREIATRWGEDPARVHHLYAKARKELAATLRRVVGWHHPERPGEAEHELQEVCRVL